MALDSIPMWLLLPLLLVLPLDSIPIVRCISIVNVSNNSYPPPPFPPKKKKKFK